MSDLTGIDPGILGCEHNVKKLWLKGYGVAKKVF